MKKKRRIPAAALAAAVLVVVLAGTALAVEYLGKVKIELLDGFAGQSGKWYSASMEGGRVPADSLSEDVWEAFASADETGDLRLTFDSRTEAETFLGLDLANNALLERMPKGLVSYHLDDQTAIQSPCAMEVTYSSGQIPAVISVRSHYREEGSACYVIEFIEFATDVVSEEFELGIRSRMWDNGDFQEYVTPNGIEATIYSETGICHAYFVKNNMFYDVGVYNSDVDTLKEILDAYE